jgi:hypothetical protein
MGQDRFEWSRRSHYELYIALKLDFFLIINVLSEKGAGKSLLNKIFNVILKIQITVLIIAIAEKKDSEASVKYNI